jgi:twitching motility protein PilT
MSKKDKASKKRLDIQVSPGEAEQLEAAAAVKVPETAVATLAPAGDSAKVEEHISTLIRSVDEISTRIAQLESKAAQTMTLEDVTRAGNQAPGALTEEIGQLREILRLNTESSGQLKSKQDNLLTEIEELKRSHEAYMQMNRDMVTIINDVPRLKENLDAHSSAYDHLKQQVEKIIAGMSDSSKPQIVVQEPDHSAIEKKLNESLELYEGLIKESEEKQKKYHLDVSAKLGALEEQLAGLSQKLKEMPAAAPQVDTGEFRALIEGLKAETHKELHHLNEKTDAAETHFNELRKHIQELKAGAGQGEMMMSAAGADSLIRKQFSEAHKSGLKFTLNTLLDVMIDNTASVLHIRRDSPPQVRVDGELIPVGDATLSDLDCARLIVSFLDKDQQETLVNKDEVNFSLVHKDILFRLNVFVQRNSIATTIKMHPAAIPSMNEFYLTDEAKSLLSDIREGLVLISGHASSGKTTLAASIIDHINSTKKLHIITLEDPIEFVHKDKISLVTQREFGTDFIYFGEALRQTLKKDPDLIFLGELDDPELMMEALMAADAGRKIISTAYGPDCIRTIERIIDSFTGEEKKKAQQLLSRTLRIIVSSRLIESQSSERKIAATEILINNREISKLIAQNRLNAILPQMEAASGEGMRSYMGTLSHLLERGLITDEDFAEYKEELLKSQAEQKETPQPVKK